MPLIRTIVRWLALSSLLALPALAAAQSSGNYPNRPIKLIVPFPPGGGTDMFGRVVAEQLGTDLGWSVVVENRPGAGGNIGVQAATQAKPDGYTLVLGQTSNLAINPTLFGNLSYSPLKDLQPVALVAESPLLFAVSAQSSLHTLQDIMSAARAKPGSISVGFSGTGTVSHLTAAFLQNEGKVKFTLVPYKGAANAMTDLMANRIDIYASSIPTLLGYVRDKKLHAIGVTSLKRVAVLPDTPAFAETDGLSHFNAITWFGILAPAGTPEEVVNTLNKAINRVLANQKVKDRFATEGSKALGGSAETFKQRLVDDTALWAKVIHDGNIRIN
jgi:tripartite-type tricarboxylate transporter receptor subunit TctC